MNLPSPTKPTILRKQFRPRKTRPPPHPTSHQISEVQLSSLFASLNLTQFHLVASTRKRNLPTWGDIKALTTSALALVEGERKPVTPETVFIAILALHTVQCSPEDSSPL
ncbi:pyrin domain-containing protein 3-like [Rhinopithecus roxellana]|uniref:pyrin domain-containing protein 3-like n=1 Tax=Rhinopithecus roxellana TaxID=61622 RepID=UPI0012370AEA|nr:pyrin domain-containing protein 3-like [Rhinopithecus roxellana]